MAVSGDRTPPPGAGGGPGAMLLLPLSQLALYVVSGLYHGLSWSPVAKRRWQRADHAMIYLKIAGAATGFAVLTEEASVVPVGLPPCKIFLRLDRSPGLSADLLVLAGNPLEDLAVLRDPEVVVFRGQWLDRAARGALAVGGAGR